MRSIVINAMIVTVNAENEVIHNGSMIFEEDTITYIGESPENLASFDQVINAHGKIVMPGLINTHTHAAMSLLRGYGDDLPLQEWLEQKMWPIEGKFQEEHIRLGTELSVIEMLKSGTTTFADMYNQMDIVADIVRQSGSRASLSRGMLGFGSKEMLTQKLKDTVRFAKQWHLQAEGRVRVMISPHSPYTCSPDFIKEALVIAKELDLPIHIHVSETEREVKLNMDRYKKRPVEHLYHLGVFDHPTLIAHAVHVNQEEINLLEKMGVKISYNPGSNLKLGSGIAPVPEMLKVGIRVALGTDSAASNNNLDMFEEMRLASLIHKGYHQDPLAISAKIAIQMATRYGAEALFMEDEIGSLEVGKKADFIILNTNQAHFHPMYDPISHIVYSASGKDVQDVFINGKQVVKYGEVLTLDEQRIIFEVEQIVNQWR
ncbi:amidohydrolase [Tepidibacillus fermentans]|uniref:5-methylthioadenosine/S-adenosylhomocysteine deaminase n=1 Tax=Tepidibacillus fermentans TaxID=1281767 RepID=A0A4R3KKZ2_9BACI|nr:amidohydrolase [Tepidibacillus fermentans]TCS84170.1 5-methylthioadenosine/S-adenosylhomocysteine deaminase [Tepidibacillus fermentans]